MGGQQLLEDTYLISDLLALAFPENAEVTIIQSNSDSARVSRIDGNWDLVVDPGVRPAWAIPFITPWGIWLKSFTCENGTVTVNDADVGPFRLYIDESCIMLGGGTLQLLNGELFRTGPTGV